ncbi:hypothetical protein N2152v2_002301 [Parachlorella kessleri]
MDKLDPVDRASTEHAIYTKESQELLNQLSSGACEASWTLQERAWAAGTCAVQEAATLHKSEPGCVAQILQRKLADWRQHSNGLHIVIYIIGIIVRRMLSHVLEKGEVSLTIKGQSSAFEPSSSHNLLQSLVDGLVELEPICHFIGHLPNMEPVATGRHIPGELRRPVAFVVRDLGVTTPNDALVGHRPCYIKAQYSIILAAAMAQEASDFFVLLC